MPSGGYEKNLDFFSSFNKEVWMFECLSVCKVSGWFIGGVRGYELKEFCVGFLFL